MADPTYLANLRKYGPNLRDRATELEKAASLANARPSESDAREMNMQAIAGRSDARKKNAALQQELSELGDQYKREARGVEAPDEGVITRVKNTIGLKNGGMTASKRADGIARRGKTKGRMV